MALSPSADPRAHEIIKTVVDFEASVADAEVALVARDWSKIDALLSDQHRHTHALFNLLEATRDDRPQAFSDEVQRRVRAITEQRADQLRRLTAFNHLVKSRLAIISQSRGMRRGRSVEPESSSRILDTHI